MTDLAPHGTLRGWLRGVDIHHQARIPLSATLLPHERARAGEVKWHYYNSGRDPFSPVLSLCGERAAPRDVKLYVWRDTLDRSCTVCLRRLCERRRPW